MNILIFIAGIITGMVVLVLVLRSVALRKKQPEYLSGKGKQFATRLAQARTRLAQIANRRSIGEARKIANKALSEIDNG